MSVLWITLAVLVGAAIVGGTAVLFLRARFVESLTSRAPSNLDSLAAPVPIAQEVKAIGAQIERAMAEQRVQGETQRQLLAQKLDSVRHAVDTQRSHVDGLRSELRHEVQRRDAEIDEIKQQIATIRSGAALPPASAGALPPAPVALSPEGPAADPSGLALAPSDDVERPAEAVTGGDGTEGADAPAEAADVDADLTFLDLADAEAEAPIAEHEGPAFDAPPALAYDDIAFDDVAFEDFPLSLDDAGDGVFAGEPDVLFEPHPEEAFGSDAFDAEPEMLTISLDDLATEELPHAVETAEVTEADEAEPDPFAEFSLRSFPPAASAEPAVQTEETCDDPFGATPIGPADSEAPAPEAGAFDTLSPSASVPLSIFEPWPPPASVENEAQEREVPPPAADRSPEAATAPEFDAGPVSSEPAPSPIRLVAIEAEEPAEVDPVAPEFGAPEFGPEEDNAPEFGAADAADEPVWVARPARPEIPITRIHPRPTEREDEEAPIAEPVTIPIHDFFPSMPRQAADAVTPEPPPFDVEAEPEAPAEPAHRPGSPPVGAEDLTVISSIDGALQQQLYAEGVYTLDEIARWGRSDARRISMAVAVSEETILTRWVFEAQAVLFNQFAHQASH